MGNKMVCSVTSTKLSFDNNNAEEKKYYYHTPKWGDPEDDVVIEATGGGSVDINVVDPSPENLGNLVEDKENFCSKIDSKGWQCHKIAKSGHTFCEHHLLSRMNKSNNGSNKNLARENSLVESDNKSIERRRRRLKKDSSSSTDPNDFYYYSGFGPRWGGKRRGGRIISSSTNNNGGSKSCNGESNKNVSHFEAPNVEGGELLGSSRVEYGEVDYMVEEDEDEDEEEGGSGKKRARKLVKARSLKSLM